MKYISIIYPVFIALACPMAALAEGSGYDDNDDEPEVEIGNTPWEGEKPGVDVEIDNGISTGIREVEATGASEAPVVTLDRAAATITIIAKADAQIPVYRIGAASISTLQVKPGRNVFAMQKGIYIIAGRKYML